MNTSEDTGRRHDEAFELIPWLVNGRLPVEQRQWLERHLDGCGECRREVEAQRTLRDAIRRDASNVEHTPHASLQKLWAQIDAEERDGMSRDANLRDAGWNPSTAQERRPVSRPSRWMVAAATVLAVGIGLVLAWTWGPQRPGIGSEYRTASSRPSRPAEDGQIRVVFAPEVTVDELTRLVSEARLAIVDGPSGSGVYTLAVQPEQRVSVADALERLRSDPRVRFAEPVVTTSQGPP